MANNRVERTSGSGAEAVESRSQRGGSHANGPLVDLSNPSTNRDFADASRGPRAIPPEFGTATLSFAPTGEQGSFQNSWQQKFLGAPQDATSTLTDAIAATGSIPSTADMSRIDATRSEISALSDVSAEVRGQALADLSISHDTIKHLYTDSENKQIADIQNHLAAGNFEGFTAALKAAGQNPADGKGRNDVLGAAERNIESGLAGADNGLNSYDRVNLRQDGGNVLAYRDSSNYALQVNPDGSPTVRALTRDDQGNVSVDPREVPASEMTPEAVFNDLSNYTADQVGEAYRNMMDYLKNPSSPPTKEVAQAPIQKDGPQQRDEPTQSSTQNDAYPNPKGNSIPQQGPMAPAGQNNPNPAGKDQKQQSPEGESKGRTPEAPPPVLNHVPTYKEGAQENSPRSFDY